MWSARGRREWSRTSIRTASGATANGQGRRAVQRRSCIEPRPEPHLGGGLQLGGRLAAAGAAAVLRVQRERRVRWVQRVERLQRAAQSAAHAPRPTPSAAPSHARRSTLCTRTDQLLLSGPPL
jgi:hypothetical protein